MVTSFCPVLNSVFPRCTVSSLQFCAAAGAAYDQFGGEHRLDSWTMVVGKHVKHAARRQLAHFVLEDLDGAQRGLAQGTVARIIEADQRDILRDTATLLCQDAHRSECYRIVRGEHCGQGG